MRSFRVFFLTLLAILSTGALAEQAPKMLAYSAFPTDYFNDHAQETAEIYDGFFFVIGSWDEGVTANLGIGEATPATTDWKEKVRANLANLKKAGATESLLGVHFADGAPWPSPETVLSEGYLQKFERHFRSIGKAAKELGFRGVSIDVEYPYKRYEFGHEIYTWDGYTAEDLLAAAASQGRTSMSALLDEFPEAVVFLLPGDWGGRPLEKPFVESMLAVMAERDAPGGMHLGYERSYCLLDPTAQVAIPRVGDLAVESEASLEGSLGDYWKRRCTVAPGVWPMHRVETGGKDYPMRTWAEELAELGAQMKTLRSVAKRYIWSYSGQPMWHPAVPELETQYGLKKQTYPEAVEAISGWQGILRKKGSNPADPKVLKLIETVEGYDRGDIDGLELCRRFGTPGEWLCLGPLGNPFTQPAFSSPHALLGPIHLGENLDGRDGAVRWFRYATLEPTGRVGLKRIFGYRNTDNCSVHLATQVVAEKETECFLHIGWDDGVRVYLGDQVVFDRLEYPERGHGMLFQDRYDFEKHVPLKIPKGSTRLAVTSVNSHGSWGFNLRLGDEEGFPVEGITFKLEGLASR